MKDIDRNRRPQSKLVKAALVVAALLLQGCVEGLVSEAQEMNASESGSALVKSPKTVQPEQDCLTIQDVSQKEKCIASSDDFRNCPESDFHCAPYKNMYSEEKKLEKTNIELMALANKKYAEYIIDDHAYLDDLMKYFNESDRAWRTYRDAQCAMEPFAQGMSRRESADITEACRLGETKNRISALKELELVLVEDGAVP